jgi:hypothetical protein
MSTKPKGIKAQIRSKKDANRQEVTELRAENAELKRQVVRLRKELDRNVLLQDTESPLSLDEDEETAKERCKFCDSADLRVFRNMAGKPIALCGKCTRRQTPGRPLE